MQAGDITNSQRFAKNNAYYAALKASLEEAVNEGAAPGITLLIARNGTPLFCESVGMKATKGPNIDALNVSTVFDLASLTEVVVTTTLIMKLLESGKINLEDRVTRYLQGFGVFGKSPITIYHLLNHTSGLPHWLPFFEDLLREQAGARRGIVTSRGAREYILTAINRMGLKYETGAKQLYSDLGFILLGAIAEMLTGLSLEKAAFKYVFQPLGMKSTSYIDLSLIKRRGIHPVTDLIAPTEDCPWRRRILCGEVHDDNAWVMGGIAGHSGLFSTALDLHIFFTEMLKAYRGHSNFLRSDTLRFFWTPSAQFEDGWRLGWDSPNRENGMDSSNLSRRAVGINGFTGCSVWLEPDYGVEILMMSNRVHPNRSNKKLLHVRPEIYSKALAFISSVFASATSGSAPAAPEKSHVG